ncbi:MAG: IS66-like element accessory protein TnpA [Burkholderiaceae bacterium]
MDTKMEKRSQVVAGEPYRITGNGRRYFSKAHKEAVIAKCLAPGASLAGVALANGFNANLVRKWVRDRLAGDMAAKSASKLVPVTLDAQPGPELPRRMRVPARVPVSNAVVGSMEIRIGTIELVVHGRVDQAQLSAVLDRLLGS